MKQNIEYRKQDSAKEAMVLDYDFGATPFGEALVLFLEKRLIGLAFADGGREAALLDMKKRYPNADFHRQKNIAAPLLKKLSRNSIVPMILIGTDFQHNVWRALLKIPAGKSVDYQTIGERLGKNNAARAIGSAVGRNPISWLVPCHRVVRRDGGLGGYHWGLATKEKLLAYEGAL